MIRRIWILFCFIVPVFAQTDIMQEEQDYRFAVQLGNKGMHDLAALQFVKYAGQYASSPRAAEALFHGAESFESSRNPEQALELYMQIVLQYPQSPFVDRALINRARLLAAAGKPLEAALTLERIRLFVPQSTLIPTALLSAGRTYHQAGDDKRALDAVYAFLEQYPTDALRLDARYLLAQIRFRQKNPQLALQELDRIKGERLEDAMAVKTNLLTAQVLYEMGRYRRADSLLQAVVTGSVKSDSLGRAALYFSRVQQGRGDHKGAVATIQAFLQKYPHVAERSALHIVAAGSQFRLGEYANALTSLKNAEQDSMSAAARAFLLARQAMTLNRLNQESAALSKWQEIVTRDTSRATSGLRQFSVLQCAQLYGRLGHPADALHLLRQAIAQPHYRQAPLLLASADIRLNYFRDFSGARRAYTTIFELYPDSDVVDEALFGLAQCAEEERSFDEAIESYGHYLSAFRAGDQVEQAESRRYYLQHFQPAGAAAVQRELQRFIASHIATQDRVAVAHAWAVQLMNVFHDYASALSVWRTISDASSSPESRMDLLYRQGLCHSRLAEKALYDRDSDAFRSQADSLRMVMADLPVQSAEFSDLAARLLLADLSNMAKPSEGLALVDGVEQKGLLPAFPDSLRQKIIRLQAVNCLAAAADTNRLLLQKGLFICQTLKGTASAAMEAEVSLLQGRFYGALQKPDSSVAVLEELVQKHPDYLKIPDALWLLAGEQEKRGKWAEALTVYQLIASQYPYSRLAMSSKLSGARMLYQLGQFKEALQVFSAPASDGVEEELALFLTDAADQDLVWFQAQTQAAAGDHYAAMAAYREYLIRSADGPHRPEALFRLAEHAAALGFNEAGVSHYEELLAEYPQDALAATARNRIADHYYDSGQYEQAKKHYQLLKSVPDPELQRLGVVREILCEYKLNNSARAKSMAEAFKKQYSDKRAEALFMKEEAEVYLNAKEFKIAESLFKDLSSRFKELPESSQGDLGLARLNIILNKNEDALKILTAIPDRYKDPQVLGTAYVTLGEFYYANQQFENCIAAGRKAMELQQAPRERAQALQLLIRVYDDVRMWDRAMSLLREYLHSYPNADDVMARKVQMGIFLINMKEYERAIAHLKELKPLVDAETEAEVQYWIAKAYNDRGLAHEAIIEYLKVKYVCKPTKLPWGTTALYEAGQAYYKIGDLGKARSLFQEIVREMGAADQFGRVANERIREIDEESAQPGTRS